MFNLTEAILEEMGHPQMGGMRSGMRLANIKAVSGVSMAPAKLTSIDDFSATANPLGSATMSDGTSVWADGPGNIGECKTTGGYLTSVTSGYAGCRVSNKSFSADQEASIVLGQVGSAHVAVRMASDTDCKCYFALVVSATQVRVYRMGSDGGTSAGHLGAWTLDTAAIGDTITLRAVGTTISVYLRGVFVNSATDTHAESGNPGCIIGATVGQIRDFSATEI